jgi:amino acid adenylation domain-containing protein/non-ribosomal peptide synthase protein (TIGR01720 family)
MLDLDTKAPEAEAEAAACASSVQQRLLWLTGATPGEARTLVAAALPGPVDATALRARLRSLVARHEILRTTFRTRPGLRFPDQVVHDAGEVEWHALTPCADREEALERLREEAGREPGPLGAAVLRAALAPLGPGDGALLVLSAPAICCDVPSLCALLEEALGGREGEEPLQYGDFAEWQASWLDEAKPSGQAATTPPLALPLHAPANAAGPRVGLCAVTLDPAETARLAASAQRGRADMESFLLAGWAALVHRLTGAPEQAVDLLTDGRDVEELAGAVGAYEVPLALNGIQIAEGMGFGALLAQLHADKREARAAQEQRVAQLGRALERDRAPLAAAATAFRYLPADVLWADAGLRAHQATVTCLRSPLGALTIGVRYDRRRFADDAVRALLAQLRHLLADAAERPEAPVAGLDILDAGSRAAALELAARHHRPPAVPDTTWHEAFAERARRDGARTAVRYADEHADQRLSFAELDERAEALARALAPHVTRPGAPVGLLAPRSAEMVVALLGILKAGAAYAPLDADLPPGRAASLLRECGAVAVVTHGALNDRLPGDLGLPVVPVENTMNAAPDGATPVGAGAGDVAYVIHTSGSTGRPKGVAVTHRSVLHLRAALRETVYAELHAEEPLRIGINGPLAFDTSVKQLVQLLDGHTLVPIPAELRLEPAALFDYLEHHRVDVLDCTPSQLSLWLAAGLLERPGLTLRALLLGGEAVPPAMWRRLADCRALAAFNLYGPTETTVDVTWCRVAGHAPRLGVPLPHARVHVLDGQGRLVPPGATGELCVSGPGLAAGYLGDPEATARAFAPNPYATEGHERLYRTGDLAHFLPDGSLEYHGRADRQVKVRGCRVEPGEIEETLAAHPAVREAVVAIRADQLAAYWVGPDADADADELHAHLAARLPDYMVPAWIVRLDAIPLNRNGKTDVAALPDPRTVTPQAPKEPPRGATEEALAAIWREVTGAAEVGREDNFFALGGDSIMSVQAATLGRRRGLAFSPLQVVRHPTPATLAAALDAAPAAAGPAAEQGAVTGEVELTPAQRRFLERRLAEPHHWNQAVPLAVHREVPEAVLREALRALAAHHDALRLRLRGQRQEIVAEETGELLTVADLSHLDDERLEAETERRAEEIQRGLDLANGPLLRALHLRCGAGRPDRLLVVAHHLAVDGVSWRILLEDLEQAVRDLTAGRPVALPAKTTSYRAWARRLWAYADGPALREQEPHWRSQAATAAERAALPSDFPGLGRRTGEAEEALFTLGAEDTGTLLRRASEVFDATFEELLLAAVWGAVREWSGASELVLDVESHGREESVGDVGGAGGVDLTRTVGWFTSVHPVRLRADAPGADYAGLVAAAKAGLRAVPTLGIGYGLLRYADTPRVPDGGAEILFNYLGRMATGDGEATFTRTEAPTGASRSPLAERTHLLEFDSSVVDGQLRLYVTYSPDTHRHRTVAALAERVLATLRAAAR